MHTHAFSHTRTHITNKIPNKTNKAMLHVYSKKLAMLYIIYIIIIIIHVLPYTDSLNYSV